MTCASERVGNFLKDVPGAAGQEVSVVGRSMPGTSKNIKKTKMHIWRFLTWQPYFSLTSCRWYFFFASERILRILVALFINGTLDTSYGEQGYDGTPEEGRTN